MILISLFSEDSVISEHFGHREADWEDQIRKGVEDVMVCKVILYKLKFMHFFFNKESNIFKFTPGRKMPGAPLYSRRNDVDFKVRCFFIASLCKINKFRDSGDLSRTTTGS